MRTNPRRPARLQLNWIGVLSEGTLVASLPHHWEGFDPWVTAIQGPSRLFSRGSGSRDRSIWLSIFTDASLSSSGFGPSTGTFKANPTSVTADRSDPTDFCSLSTAGRGTQVSGSDRVGFGFRPFIPRNFFDSRQAGGKNRMRRIIFVKIRYPFGNWG